MKKIVALLTLVPSLAALGDIAPPIRRVQRIGYEVFGGVNPTTVLAKDQAGDFVELMTDFLTSNMVGLAIILTMLGFVLVLVLLIARRDVVKKMLGAVKSKCPNGWYEVIGHCAFFGLAVGVLCLLCWSLLGWDWSLEMCFLGLLGALFAVVCKVTSVLVRACLRRKVFWCPWTAEMLLFFLAVCVFAHESNVKGQNWRRRRVIAEMIYADNPGWKYPHEVTAAERESINAKIAAVKDELQARFDLEYEKLNSAGKLGKITLFRGVHIYMQDRWQRRLAEENAQNVVSSVLEQDKQLRDRLHGVPVEWLAENFERQPSLDENSVKEAFRDWSMQRMPLSLSDSQQKIVFNWQFAVVEKEKRPWKDVVVDKGSTVAHEDLRMEQDWGKFNPRDRRKTAALAHTPGFEDFEQASVPADVFVTTWYEKAVRAGMTPTKEEMNKVKEFVARDAGSMQ